MKPDRTPAQKRQTSLWRIKGLIGNLGALKHRLKPYLLDNELDYVSGAISLLLELCCSIENEENRKKFRKGNKI